ncbi:MAG: hypothetical protein ACRDP7_06385 [Trebonia sp.]
MTKTDARHTRHGPLRTIRLAASCTLAAVTAAAGIVLTATAG